MKNTVILALTAFLLGACASGMLGKKVREPFQGASYESNNRFWRATGKGESSQDNIARGRADIDAKAQLGAQVNVTMKQVADQYLGQRENEKGADVADKFESLVREVMNTPLADLQKIGEKKYYNDKTKSFTVFIAYEIKKSAMLRYMKKQAKVQANVDESQRQLIESIIDDELAKAEAEDNK